MRADGASNAIFVVSPSFLYNAIKTTSEAGNTRGGIASTTHTGELHVLLVTPSKQIILMTKQSCVMPSNDHNTLGLSPFLINGCHWESRAVNECTTIGLAEKDRASAPITLVRNYLDFVSIKIIVYVPADEIQNNNTPIPVCHRTTMTASSLN